MMQMYSLDAYPELEEAVATLRDQVLRDFPGENFPEIRIIAFNPNSPSGIATTALDGAPLIAAYHRGDYVSAEEHASLTLGKNTQANPEYGELITIRQDAVEHYGIQTALAMIAHEVGHDIQGEEAFNPMLTIAGRKGNECQADHFAAKYASAEALAKFYQVRNGLLGTLGIDSTHPRLSHRIAMLNDPEIIALPFGVKFNYDCTPKQER